MNDSLRYLRHAYLRRTLCVTSSARTITHRGDVAEGVDLTTSSRPPSPRCAYHLRICTSRPSVFTHLPLKVYRLLWVRSRPQTHAPLHARYSRLHCLHSCSTRHSTRHCDTTCRLQALDSGMDTHFLVGPCTKHFQLADPGRTSWRRGSTASPVRSSTKSPQSITSPLPCATPTRSSRPTSASCGRRA